MFYSYSAVKNYSTSTDVILMYLLLNAMMKFNTPQLSVRKCFCEFLLISAPSNSLKPRERVYGFRHSTHLYPKQPYTFSWSNEKKKSDLTCHMQKSFTTVTLLCILSDSCHCQLFKLKHYIASFVSWYVRKDIRSSFEIDVEVYSLVRWNIIIFFFFFCTLIYCTFICNKSEEPEKFSHTSSAYNKQYVIVWMKDIRVYVYIFWFS